MSLYSDFQKLQTAPSAGEFAAVPIHGRQSDFLGKDVNGAPVFLLSDSSAVRYTPGTTLKHLSVQYHVTCRVQSYSEIVDGQFALIACNDSAPELYELFVQCVDAAVSQLPAEARTQDIESCVRSLLNLFRAMSTPSGREIAGLWGELFVIAHAADVAVAVDAWHADTFERFDFSWLSGVLEVKTTQGSTREHEFALEQLVAPSRIGLVISLLLQPLTNGTGVMDLATKIDAALLGRGELRQRLWTNIAASLGNDFGEKLDRRYDVGFAERHLAVFNMADIPAPNPPSDPRVSSLRFRSNLSTVKTSVAKPPLEALRDAIPSDPHG